VEQSRDPTNRNRIEGVPARTSEHRIAKSLSIKGSGRRSGGGAAKAVGLTLGGLLRVPRRGLRAPRGALIAQQESAEGIVVRMEPARLSGTLARKERNGRGSQGRSDRTKARTVGRD
jgi:hypothetical protein